MQQKTQEAPVPQPEAAAPQANDTIAETTPTVHDDAQKSPELAADNQLADTSADTNNSMEPESDSEEESDSNEDCGYWVENYYSSVPSFSHRNEIQGDLSQAKWSELEPKLPLPVLKANPDEDVIKKLESMLNYKCSKDIDQNEHEIKPKTASDGTIVSLIFCSKKDRPRSYLSWDNKKESLPSGFYVGKERDGSDGSECNIKKADAMYLSLVNSKDHHTRVYQIDSDIELSYIGWCINIEDEIEYGIEDIQLRAFMDTNGLYIRIYKNYESIIEHNMVDDMENYSLTSTTWLFAGDKHRLVTHWNDCLCYADSAYNYDEDDSDNTKRCGRFYNLSSYEETYMYYEQGEFKPVTKRAENKKELDKLIAGRP